METALTGEAAVVRTRRSIASMRGPRNRDEPAPIIFGVVLEPETVGAQNDLSMGNEVREAAHRSWRSTRTSGSCTAIWGTAK
jgi:hypothetical protein